MYDHKTTPHDSPGTLVLRNQRSPRNSTVVTPYGATNAGGVGQNRRLSTNNRLSLENAVKDRHIVSIKSRIGIHMRSIEWWHCPWPWVPPNRPKPPQFSAFCTAIHSFVTGDPRDFKFGTLIYHSKSHPADEKSSLKGAWSGSADPFWNFTPSCKISATANARDFKFCTRVDHAKS